MSTPRTARFFCRGALALVSFFLSAGVSLAADNGQSKVAVNPADTFIPAFAKTSGDGSGYRLAVEYVYDTYGHLIQVRNAQEQSIIYWQANTADAFGHITQQTLGNGLVTTKVFDPATGQLQSITTGRAGNPSQIQNLAYTWDAIGNLEQRQDINHNLTETFTYDPLNRLTQTVVNSVVTEALSYDAIGNLTDRTRDTGSGNVTTQLVYDLAGQAGPHAVTALKNGSGVTTESYSYDANGNLIAGGGRTVDWNAANYPVAISQGGHTTEFTYGPNRQRITQTETDNGTLQRTTISIGSLFEQSTDAIGDTTYRHFIRANGQTVAIHTRTSDYTQNTTYPLRDHLGSLSTLTNEDGDVIAELSFDAWGNRRDPTDWRGSATNPAPGETDRGYTGHKMLDGVALIHMNGRVYDPAIGRFLSADPIIQAPYNSQSYNRYSYVWNNPLSNTDPSGFVKNQDDSNITCPSDRDTCTDEQLEDIYDCERRHGSGNCAMTREGMVIPLSALSSEVQRALRQAGPGVFVAADLANLTLPDPGQSWDNLLASAGQGFADAVPGGYLMGQSELAWQDGNYFTSGLLFVGALADAWMGLVTGGESSALLNTMRRTVFGVRGLLTTGSRALTPYFPAANGFLGPSLQTTLKAGTLIDRYGGTAASRFFSPAGTPLGARALPPGTAAQGLRSFEVIKALEVEAGTVAPAYGQMGLGVQYRTSHTLDDLIEQGYLREISP